MTNKKQIHSGKGKWIFPLLVCSSLRANTALALPLGRDEVTLRPLKTPPDLSSTDGAVLSFAKGASVNILADSTYFPAGEAVLPYPSTSGAIKGTKGPYADKWTPIFLNSFLDFAAQKNMGMLRTDENTFLLWSRPDTARTFYQQLGLTKAVENYRFEESAAAAKATGIPPEKAVTGPLSHNKLNEALQHFLKDQYGWVNSIAQRTKDANFHTPINDLPPDLKALVLLDLREQFCLQNWEEMTGDSFWNDPLRHVNVEKEGEGLSLTVPFQSKEIDGISFTSSYSLPLPKDLEVQPPLVALEVKPPTNGADLTEKPVTLDALLTQKNTSPLQDYINAYLNLSDDPINPILLADTRLAKPVSLDFNRTDLREVADQLSQQSGVKFDCAADVPDAYRITGHVSQIPAARLMALTSRLYGVTWDRQLDGNYMMHGDKQGELHHDLLRLGDPEFCRLTRTLMNRPAIEARKEEVALGVVKATGIEALQSQDGVLFSTLPLGIANTLRETCERIRVESNEVSMMDFHRRVVEQIADNHLELHFGYIDIKKFRWPNYGLARPDDPDLIGFSIQSEDGTINWPVFSNFQSAVARPNETGPKPPSRRR